MSEFYKKKRDWIIKNYRYLGLKERVSFYFCRSLIIVFAVRLCKYLNISKDATNNKASIWIIVLIIGGIIALYYVSKSDNKKHHDDKMDAVFQFVQEPDINIEIVNELIKEIEKYIKRLKTFASWITGLSATFIILLATLTTNYYMKLFDVYIKVIPTDELSRLIENTRLSGHVNGSAIEFFNIGSMLLISFIIMILIIYNVFAIFTFVKEQILVFLFDARYEILSSNDKNENNDSVELSSKNN